MSKIAKLISIAKGEVGYHEGRTGSMWNNHQKYSPAVPGLEWSQNQAWCATFVSWCAMKAGLEDYYPRTASTDLGASWFKAKGQWSEYPAVGAQGFLGTNGDMHHTFIVRDYDDTYVYTIEGNTNNNGSAQGDGVYMLKRVRRSTSIQGYGYPAVPGGLKSADPSYKRPVVKDGPSGQAGTVGKDEPKGHAGTINIHTGDTRGDHPDAAISELKAAAKNADDAGAVKKAKAARRIAQQIRNGFPWLKGGK